MNHERATIGRSSQYLSTGLRTKPDTRTVFFVLIWLAAAILFWDQGALLKRFSGLGVRAGEIISWSEFLAKRAVFLVEQLVALVCVASACFSTSRILGLLIISLFTGGLFVDFSHFYIRGIFPNLNDLAITFEGLGEASKVASEYFPSFLKGLVAALCVTLPCFFMLLRRHRTTLKWAGTVALASLMILFALYVFIARDKGEAGLAGFPRGMSAIVGSTTLALFVERPTDTGMQYLTEIAPLGQFDKIVVVMDESITTRVFREVQGGLGAHDNIFVYRSQLFSGANISAASNYFFRKTIAIDAKRIQVASLFQLAEAHHFETLYIDNQGNLDDPGAKNYFDRHEIAFINERINNASAQSFRRDQLSLDQTLSWLNLRKRGFVFINKLGSHIPYDNTIPPEARSDDRDANYRESIKRNSIQWISDLAERISDDTIVVYTADHGQNLGPGASHGNPGSIANATEWEVPFVVVSRSRTFMEEIARSRLLNSSFITHDDISEFSRNLLGFSSRGPAYVIQTDESAGTYCGHYGPPYAIFSRKTSEASCKRLYP